jgi:hypothetical protein
LGIEGMFLNTIKAIYDKPKANHYTKKITTETIPTKARNETEMTIFPIPVQYSFGIPSKSNRTRARIKRN